MSMAAGSIIFPREGSGWYFLDDVLALKAWLEKYGAEHSVAAIDKIYEFVPGNDEKPFGFVAELYRERLAIKKEAERTGRPNIQEKTIKLTINAIAGKMAQRVSWVSGKPPTFANPYYAGAITAFVRRELLEVSMMDPHAIVSFATDGIVSERDLYLDRRRVGDGIGQWNVGKTQGGFFVQSGMYTFQKPDEDSPFVNRLRGSKKPVGGEELHKQMIDDFLHAWGTPIDELGNEFVITKPDGEKLPAVSMPQKVCVTASMSVADLSWSRLCGRFGEKPNKINADTTGNKRGFDPIKADLQTKTVRQADGSLRLALRCHSLVSTFPACNPTPWVDAAACKVKWLVDDLQEEVEAPDGEGEGSFDALHKQAEIWAGFA